MTQEEKQLLLVDLSARLPYGVIVQYPNIFRPSEVIKRRLEEISYSLIGIDEYKININDDGIEIGYLKPYLRPMSSMTESERFEVEQIIGYDTEVRDDYLNLLSPSVKRLSYAELLAVFEWLNAHHFDYRNLIERGLAIEVTEDNNPYKE